MSPEGSPPSGISLGNPSHHADFCPQRALPPPVQGQTRAQAFQAIKGLSGPGLRHEPRGSLRRQRTASLILSSLWPCPLAQACALSMFQPPWLLPETRVMLPLTGHQAPVMSSLAQQQVGRNCLGLYGAP